MSCVGTLSNLSSTLAADDAASADAAIASTPVAPGKFIPTFTILYAGAKSDEVLKEAARFDLIDAGVHAATDVNTWPGLRKQNPHLKIFTYLMGPGEFNTWTDFKPRSGLGLDERQPRLNQCRPLDCSRHKRRLPAKQQGTADGHR